ncbi:MAG: BatD family protein, partial [Planctomycetota bacterium]
MSTRTVVLALIGLVGAGLETAAQSPAEIRVHVVTPKGQSVTRVYEGRPVYYLVAVISEEGTSPPKLAGLDDFDVQSLGAPSVSQSSFQHRDIQGRVTRIRRISATYRYRLIPRKTGILRIPPPAIDVGGQTVQGPERLLEVIPADEQDTAFLEIVSDRQSVYPLQPFRVTLRIAVKRLAPPFADRDPVSVQRELRSGQPEL